MSSVLVRRLEAFGRLPDADRTLLDSSAAHLHNIEADTDLIREGDTPSDAYLITSGLACRYKILQSGSRQIVAYLLPGDLSDMHVSNLKTMDHTIATLSNSQVARLSRTVIATLLERPAIARALLLTTLVDKAVLHEWLANLGQRPAEHRLAHLFCELHLRLQSVGLASNGIMELPLTQTELGDTTGLSTVHVNRSLQSLRAQGLITLRGRKLAIHDIEQLQRLSGFRANYLHLDEAAVA